MSDNYNSEDFSAVHIECLKKSIDISFFFIDDGSLKFAGEKQGDGLWMSEGIVGIISLIGDLSWSVSLGMPKDTAINFAKRFAGFDIDYDSVDMDDVTGELINVLAGDIVAQLDAIGASVDMSLPTVARGSQMEVHVPDRLPRIQLHYESSLGGFALNLTSGKFHGKRK